MDLKNELTKSLESCFAVEDGDIERITSWYVEMAGANEEAEKLSKQLKNEVHNI